MSILPNALRQHSRINDSNCLLTLELITTIWTRKPLTINDDLKRCCWIFVSLFFSNYTLMGPCWAGLWASSKWWLFSGGWREPHQSIPPWVIPLWVREPAARQFAAGLPSKGLYYSVAVIMGAAALGLLPKKLEEDTQIKQGVYPEIHIIGRDQSLSKNYFCLIGGKRWDADDLTKLF